MTTMPDPAPRTLLVLSKDYGELGVAQTLLRGQQLAGGARMLLPQRLYAINQDALPVPASPYATLDEILDVLDTHDPNLVFLLSGYLLTNDRLLTRSALATLLGRLRERDCPVLTSDPFLGLAPRLTLAQVDAKVGAPSEPLWARWLTLFMLRARGRRAKALRVPALETTIHLYPTSLPADDDGIPKEAYFNPAVIREAGSGPATSGNGGAAPGRWLFVLSLADVHVQRVLVGLHTFIDRLCAILRQAAEAGGSPTLLAPSWLIQRLPPDLAAAVEILPTCPYAEFERRLVDAQYVFYWNAFSNSVVTRLANELPIFLFDRGHLARTIKPFYEIARSCYFGGWEPPYLDQRAPLDPDALRTLGEEQKPAMRTIRTRWRSMPTPDELANRLIHRAASRERDVAGGRA